MNYTDKFFEFPVRVYDGFERRKALEKEERALELDPESAVAEESPWVEGKVAVLPDHILGYMDSFSKDRHWKDVEEEGFDLLVVETKLQGDFLCTWDLDTFKKKFNEFMIKYEADKLEELKNSPVMSTYYIALPSSEKKE